MVRDAARGRHRGHPRRRLQPHRRGQPPRARRCRFRGIDNAAYYRLVDDDPQHYMDYTGTGNTLNVRQPHSLQLIMDSLRYWVTEMHVDGFRFDLRRDPGPRVLRRRPAVALLRTRAAGSGGQPGQADRRAVGRRPRRLPGRQLPAAVDGVERQVPRHRPRLLARRAGHDRRVRGPPHRLGRPVRDLRPPPGGQHQLRHRARRLHAARPRLATTRSTTRPTATTTTTARATTGRGTAASRARPTTRSVLALRGQQQRNFLATLFLSQGVPMICHGDELGRTQRGNNNGYCQDNETDLDRLGERRRRPARVHPAGRRAAPRAPDLPPAPLLRRPPGAAARAGRPAGHRLVRARTARR